MRARAFAPWIALAVVLGVSLAVLVARSAPSDAPAARAARIAQQIKCPDCQGESVANSSTPTAIAIRADIRTRVDHGETDGDIYAYYEARYPDSRMSPSGHGIDLLIWVLPIVAVIAGLGVIAIVIRRSGRVPRLAASAEDEQLVARARHTTPSGEVP